eukprot:TRINITY_DN1918_c0_g3_i1.p1 TRINITY_DN1918_c0_g3~~TRINITY_DN1918_c0_g3_i1.p1  ORF type:complete len:951 (-),score=296.58 TRINITY_DN1918_c0_g3_i1:164-2902(-)
MKNPYSDTQSHTNTTNVSSMLNIEEQLDGVFASESGECLKNVLNIGASEWACFNDRGSEEVVIEEGSEGLFDVLKTGSLCVNDVFKDRSTDTNDSSDSILSDKNITMNNNTTFWLNQTDAGSINGGGNHGSLAVISISKEPGTRMIFSCWKTSGNGFSPASMKALQAVCTPAKSALFYDFSNFISSSKLQNAKDEQMQISLRNSSAISNLELEMKLLEGEMKTAIKQLGTETVFSIGQEELRKSIQDCSEKFCKFACSAFNLPLPKILTIPSHFAANPPSKKVVSPVQIDVCDELLKNVSPRIVELVESLVKSSLKQSSNRSSDSITFGRLFDGISFLGDVSSLAQRLGQDNSSNFIALRLFPTNLAPGNSTHPTMVSVCVFERSEDKNKQLKFEKFKDQLIIPMMRIITEICQPLINRLMSLEFGDVGNATFDKNGVSLAANKALRSVKKEVRNIPNKDDEEEEANISLVSTFSRLSLLSPTKSQPNTPSESSGSNGLLPSFSLPISAQNDTSNPTTTTPHRPSIPPLSLPVNRTRSDNSLTARPRSDKTAPMVTCPKVEETSFDINFSSLGCMISLRRINEFKESLKRHLSVLIGSGSLVDSNQTVDAVLIRDSKIRNKKISSTDSELKNWVFDGNNNDNREKVIKINENGDLMMAIYLNLSINDSNIEDVDGNKTEIKMKQNKKKTEWAIVIRIKNLREHGSHILSILSHFSSLVPLISSSLEGILQSICNRGSSTLTLQRDSGSLIGIVNAATQAVDSDLYGNSKANQKNAIQKVLSLLFNSWRSLSTISSFKQKSLQLQESVAMESIQASIGAGVLSTLSSLSVASPTELTHSFIATSRVASQIQPLILTMLQKGALKEFENGSENEYFGGASLESRLVVIWPGDEEDGVGKRNYWHYFVFFNKDSN